MLALSLLRTCEMFLVSRTVAADIGTLFLKKDLSRTRIARLTGGRNMFDESPEEEEAGLDAALEAIDWWLIRARAEDKKRLGLVEAPKNLLVSSDKLVGWF